MLSRRRFCTRLMTHAGAVAGLASFTAAAADGTPIDAWTVTLVTARAVVKPGDARAVADRFTRRSAIHAHATFSTEGHADAGAVKFEMKWFNGQRRVSVKKIDAVVTTSPHYVAVQTSGNAVGEGDCRVEVHANGKLMASRRFRVDAI